MSLLDDLRELLPPTAEGERVFNAVRELEAALRYACGYDVAGWDAHMRPDEILAKVRVAPFPSFAASPVERGLTNVQSSHGSVAEITNDATPFSTERIGRGPAGGTPQEYGLDG